MKGDRLYAWIMGLAVLVAAVPTAALDLPLRGSEGEMILGLGTLNAAASR